MASPIPPSNESVIEDLRRLLQAIEVTGYAILPRSNLELLRSIVEAAARIFGAGASSIALLDEEAGELEFVVDYNARGQGIVGVRIPMDQGLAGYVAMTGQALAVSNVEEDARFRKDFAEKTGYVPQSILACPLLLGEKVIGVMEVLDKIDAPSFGLEDIELLSLFAHQAAQAIHQSHLVADINDALVLGLHRLADDGDDDNISPLEAALAERRASPPADLLALAEIFNDLAALGESERKACLGILEIFKGFRKRHSRFGL